MVVDELKNPILAAEEEFNFGFLMDETGNSLTPASDRVRRTEGVKAELLGETLARDRVLSRDYFRKMQEAAQILMAEEEENPEGKMRVGPIFAYGEEGLVAALVYSPVTHNSDLHGIEKVVKGTTAMVMLQDRELAADLCARKYLTRDIRTEQLMKSLQRVTHEIKQGEARAVGRWTGWGSTPQAGLNTNALIMEASEQDNVPVKLIVQPAFFGSNKTLKEYDDLSDKEQAWDGVNLGSFVYQIEDFWKQVGTWISPDKPPEETIPGLFDRFWGHSMGGYLAILCAMARPETPVLSRFNELGKPIYADKPVVLGTNYQKDVPPWLQEFANSEQYKAHVLLMSDGISSLVRLGSDPIWGDDGWKAALREKVLEVGMDTPALPAIFSHYMDPIAMHDGSNILLGHMYNFTHDRQFHEFCNRLLDSAPPVVDEKKLATLAQGEFDNLFMLFGGEDKTLTHYLGKGLGERLGLDRFSREGLVNSHINESRFGVHYPSVEEILWMAGVRQFSHH